MTPGPADSVTDDQVRGMDDMLDAAIFGLLVLPVDGADLRRLAGEIRSTPFAPEAQDPLA